MVVLFSDVYPVMLKTFRDRVSQPGPVVSLLCLVSGTPPPTVQWYFDDMLIDDGKDRPPGYSTDTYAGYMDQVTSWLNISHVRVDHGGLYRCEAVNKAGRSSHSARLDVYGLPHVRSMRNRSIIAGEPFTVRCHAYGYPIHSYQWTRGKSSFLVHFDDR